MGFAVVDGGGAIGVNADAEGWAVKSGGGPVIDGGGRVEDEDEDAAA